VTLAGAEVTLVDVAGFAKVEDDLARLALAKAERERMKADLVVIVVDGGEENPEDFLAENSGRPCVVAWNKIDLARAGFEERDGRMKGGSGAV